MILPKWENKRLEIVCRRCRNLQAHRAFGTLTHVFTVLPPLLNVETIAKGRGIRELRRLARIYGKGNWLKKKGIARVRLAGGAVLNADNVECGNSLGRSSWHRQSRTQNQAHSLSTS